MRTLKFISSLLVFCLLSSAAFSQNTKKQEAKKARLEKEIAVLDRQLKENKEKSSNALTQLKLLQNKIVIRKELLDQSNRQIASYDRQIKDTQGQIAHLEQRLDTLSAHYSRLVSAVYKNRDAKVWYMYILASDNLSQAYRRYGYFKNMSANLKAQSLKIRQTQQELEDHKTMLKSLRNDADILRAQQRQEVKALATEEGNAQVVIANLKKDQQRYEQQLAQKRKQVEDLKREIERIIREAMKSKSGSGKSNKPIDYTLAAEFSKNKGKLPWPADGPVTDPFGQRYHPVFTTVKMPFNNGIGISLKADTKVCAVFDGVVKQILVMPGYNKCVLVQHGNYFSFYCKLKNCSVKAGDKVKTGQTIGVVDTINGETELHFQIWQDQTPQNPTKWLRPR